MSVKCTKCNQTLLKKGEKAHRKHFTPDACALALARNINRDIKRSVTALRHLQKAHELLDLAQADIDEINKEAHS